MYAWNGSISINDDDEQFLSADKEDVTGIVVMRLSQEEFLKLITKLSKVDPDYANKKIINEYYKANTGECCGIEYHSTWKKETCVNCGRNLSLT